jgi:hypothetical protein
MMLDSNGRLWIGRRTGDFKDPFEQCAKNASGVRWSGMI